MCCVYLNRSASERGVKNVSNALTQIRPLCADRPASFITVVIHQHIGNLRIYLCICVGAGTCWSCLCGQSVNRLNHVRGDGHATGPGGIPSGEFGCLPTRQTARTARSDSKYRRSRWESSQYLLTRNQSPSIHGHTGSKSLGGTCVRTSFGAPCLYAKPVSSGVRRTTFPAVCTAWELI